MNWVFDILAWSATGQAKKLLAALLLTCFLANIILLFIAFEKIAMTVDPAKATTVMNSVVLVGLGSLSMGFLLSSLMPFIFGGIWKALQWAFRRNQS